MWFQAKADEEKEVVTDMKNVLVSVQKQLQQTAIDLDTAQREKVLYIMLILCIYFGHVVENFEG